MRAATADRIKTALALAALAAVSVAYFTAARSRIDATLAAPNGAQAMGASDSRHYLEIAEELSGGDWSLDYVRPTGGPDRAHRQALYPVLLALVMRLGGHDLADLATLNAVLVVASMWVAYAIGVFALGSHLAGLAGAAVLWRIPYLWDNATTRLLTEPGYVLLTLVLSLCALRYATTRRPAWLYAAAFTAALCYLQRVNGLVTGVLALAFLAFVDFRRRVSSGRRQVARSGAQPESLGHDRDAPAVPDVRSLLVRHAIAAAIFVVAAAPSWLPRLVHADDPLYHGYLPNYLWVDDYERAHVPGPPRYGWRDYAREHDLGDAAARMRYGLRRALWSAPREKYGDLVAAAMLAGVVLTVATRNSTLLAWYGVGLLALLPLAWTAMSNPVRRIPATALLAFGVVAVVAGTAMVVRAAQRRLEREGVVEAPTGNSRRRAAT